ncbi:hypothetical protein ATANTOWER_009323 [Ataeniobius toweri]|uniref:Uncharacterized protein n=1 Tax=Ataeniobius toweri TaxID=208326 RepID=A0ABU7BSA2_9TELE|nr:hypothetical protein [Ataeniobius toweri]
MNELNLLQRTATGYNRLPSVATVVDTHSFPCDMDRQLQESSVSERAHEDSEWLHERSAVWSQARLVEEVKAECFDIISYLCLFCTLSLFSTFTPCFSLSLSVCL